MSTIQTLTYAQLREDINALPAYSPHLPTNVISLSHVCGEIFAELDDSTEEDLREELCQTISSLEDANRQTTDAEARANQAEEECITLRNEMDLLSDPSEDGETVLTYRDRTKAAEAQTEQFRQFMVQARQRVEEAEAETKALRTRKGIPAGVFKHLYTIADLLASVSRLAINQQHAQAAAELLGKIRNP